MHKTIKSMLAAVAAAGLVAVTVPAIADSETDPNLDTETTVATTGSEDPSVTEAEAAQSAPVADEPEADDPAEVTDAPNSSSVLRSGKTVLGSGKSSAVTANPQSVYLTEAEFDAPDAKITFHAECAEGYNISWEHKPVGSDTWYESASRISGGAWVPITTNDFVLSKNPAIGEGQFDATHSGKQVRAVCTNASDSTDVQYSAEAEMFWLLAEPYHIKETTRTLLPYPKMDFAANQAQPVASTETSITLGFGTNQAQLETSDMENWSDITGYEPRKGNKLGQVKFTWFRDGVEVATTTTPTFEVDLTDDANLRAKFTVKAEITLGGKTLTVTSRDSEWLELVRGADFRESYVSYDQSMPCHWLGDDDIKVHLNVSEEEFVEDDEMVIRWTIERIHAKNPVHRVFLRETSGTPNNTYELNSELLPEGWSFSDDYRTLTIPAPTEAQLSSEDLFGVSIFIDSLVNADYNTQLFPPFNPGGFVYTPCQQAGDVGGMMFQPGKKLKKDDVGVTEDKPIVYDVCKGESLRGKVGVHKHKEDDWQAFNLNWSHKVDGEWVQIDVDPEDPLKLPSAYADNYKDGDLFNLEFRGAEGHIYKIYLSINEVECAKPTEAETSAGAGTKPVTEVGTGNGTQAGAKSATAGSTEAGAKKLPTTGANTAGLMLVAGLLLVTGGTLIGIRRRWNN